MSVFGENRCQKNTCKYGFSSRFWLNIRTYSKKLRTQPNIDIINRNYFGGINDQTLANKLDIRDERVDEKSEVMSTWSSCLDKGPLSRCPFCPHLSPICLL